MIMGGQQLPTIRMPENRQMSKDRQRKDSALEVPDTGYYIYYPAVNYLWSDLRSPVGAFFWTKITTFF